MNGSFGSFTHRLLAIVALGLTLLASGCGEEDDDIDRLRVQLLRANDSTPVAQGELSLFDLVESRYRLLVEVDSEGRADLRPPVPGLYVPVVRVPGFEVFGWTADAIRLGESGRVVEAPILLWPSRPLTDTEVRVVGKVLDGVTGLPVAGAQVEMTSPDLLDPNFSEYLGSRSATEPVTDAEGRFVIDPAPLRLVPGGNQPVTGDLRVRAAGYRSTWRVGWARFQVPAEVVIELTPGRDAGRIEGRVVDAGGNPIAGVGVRAEWRAAPPQVATAKAQAFEFLEDDARPLGLLLPAVSLSDASGHFVLNEMPPGSFHVRAGASRTDGFVSARARQVTLDPDSSAVELEDLVVFPAIRLRGPQSGSTVPPDQVLSWELLPEAASYVVSIGRGDGSFATTRTESTSLRLPTGDFTRGGAWYRWRVIAQDAADRDVGASETAWIFRVDEAPARRPGG